MDQIVKKCMESLSLINPIESFVQNDEEDVIFFANMCHVCHGFGEKGISLKRCGGCNMISYCGGEHQKKDWPSHRNFCKAICQIKKEWKLDNIFQSLKCSNKSDKSISTVVNEARSRVEFKARLRSKVTQILKRVITPHELQMIHFPRVCAVCFESKSELLTNCKKCPQTSFCKEHLNDPSHQEVCPKMLTAFSIEEKNKHDLQILIEVAKRLKVSYQPKALKLPNSMQHFLETYIPEGPQIKTKMADEAEHLFAVMSEKFSRSLSLLFAMEKLNLVPGSRVTVHVIGANLEEVVMNDWEVILHWLPQLSELKLVLIGPDVLLNLENVSDVCKHCKKNKKKLIIEIKQCMYEDYFYKEDFQKPNIIVGFNSGLYAYPTWNKAMGVLGKINCPLMITAYNQIEAYREQDKISTMYGTAKCVFFQMNPFASLLYMRSHVHEATFSKNEFMLVYENLRSGNA